MRRPKLVIPAALAVSTLGVLLACDDDNGTETSGSETSGATSTGSAPQECADIVDEAACAAETRFECVWNPDNEECQIDCAAYPDEQSCSEEILCAWDDNAGCLGPI
jgi:hypothetical protein